YHLALSLSALAVPAAGAPVLMLPVDCEIGKSCYIQQYMDHDPSEQYQDFQCGPRSYDGHKGTDFAVPTAADAKAGINILAAAAGTVLGTRDGMQDVWDGKYDGEAIKGRDCGNGLVIEHSDGWQTQYCHMQNGSLAVSKGDKVDAGTVLGKIGMSGRTEFAHMHLSVRKDGTPIDPFAPNGANCGGSIEKTLWNETPQFQPGGFLALGFADLVPEFSDIKMGVVDTKLTRISPALVTYAYLFGGKAGDTVEMTFTGPGDFRVSESYELPKALAQFFRAIGKKRRSAPWPGGEYQAIATLYRDGEIIDTAQSTFEIPR
ncbi:MAG: M23 family metallopeptidase, partial [Planktotalea sp.]|uniref:M23 family metallopeptidase n=1 Tax=Planktotalea sp. TaxID=2029877 RepID=UPI003C71E1F8